MKVIVNTSCKNSPKREFLKDWNIAFVEGNSAFVLDSVSEDVTWNRVGDSFIQGKEAFEQALEEMKTDEATALTLDKIVTHGKEGAVNGVIVTEGGKNYAFCDVYDTNTKGTIIKSMVSYVIEIPATQRSFSSEKGAKSGD